MAAKIKTQMEKYIPNLKSVTYLLPMLGRNVDWDNLEAHMTPPTKEEYFEALDKFEKRVEEELKDILIPIGIRAVTKADRKSLPHKNEITRQRRITSLVNDAYETEEFFRNVVHNLLDLGYEKVRFYIDCEHVDMGKGLTGGTGFRFNFRYY